MNWIKVEDQLPDCQNKRYGVNVLGVLQHLNDGKVYRTDIHILPFSQGFFYNNYIEDSHKYPNKYGKVTHWMYLPKRPKK